MDNVLIELKANIHAAFNWVDDEIKRLNNMTDFEYIESITAKETKHEKTNI